MSSGRLASLPTRAWILMGAMAALVVVAAAWLVVISPVRSDTGQLRTETQDVQTQNLTLVAKNNKLRDLAAHKKQLVAELEAALRGLPSGPNLPTFSRQLATQAAARSVTLTGVSVGTPVSPMTGAGTTTTSPDPTTGSTDSTTGTTADTTDSTTSTTTGTTDSTISGGAATAPATAQSLAIPVTITSSGPALQQLLFMRDIEQTGPRLALVTSAAFAPAEGGATDGSISDDSTLTLQLTVFTNPLPKATRQQLAQVAGALTGTSDAG